MHIIDANLYRWSMHGLLNDKICSIYSLVSGFLIVMYGVCNENL